MRTSPAHSRTVGADTQLPPIRRPAAKDRARASTQGREAPATARMPRSARPECHGRPAGRERWESPHASEAERGEGRRPGAVAERPADVSIHQSPQPAAHRRAVAIGRVRDGWRGARDVERHARSSTSVTTVRPGSWAAPLRHGCATASPRANASRTDGGYGSQLGWWGRGGGRRPRQAVSPWWVRSAADLLESSQEASGSAAREASSVRCSRVPVPEAPG